MSSINGGTLAFAPLHAGIHRKTVQLGQVARAETAQLLAGGNRLLYEMATGKAGANASHPGEALVPPNPQGEIGIDKSGAPYGLVHKTPLFWRGGWKTDTPSAQWSGWWGRYDPVSSSRGAVYEFDVWVKPFPPVEYTPLSRAYLDWRADVGASTTTLTFTFRANGQTMGSASTSGLSAGDNNGQITAVWWSLRPGWNSLALEIESDNATDTEIYCLVGNQIKEYSHESGLW